jgi:hypothetical protein
MKKIRYKVETRSTSVGTVERIIHRHKQSAVCANEFGTS